MAFILAFLSDAATTGLVSYKCSLVCWPSRLSFRAPATDSILGRRCGGEGGREPEDEDELTLLCRVD
jgi:hypothetical protein